jgi:L,D-transpeptidase YcbB
MGRAYRTTSRARDRRGTALARNSHMDHYLPGVRYRPFGLALTGVILTSLVLGCRASTSPEETAEIRAALADPALGVRAANTAQTRPAVRRFYHLRGMVFAWSAKKPLSAADDALALIAAADAHGLDPAAYGFDGLRATRDQLAANPAKGDAGRRELARFDVRLTTSLVSLGHDIAVGRTRPNRWRAQRKLPDLGNSLADARNGRLSSWLDTLRPPHEEYVGLQRALVALRGVQAKGGWPSVSLARTKASRAALVRRLAMSGDLEDANTPTAETIGDAVQSFQSHHGLSPTGRLDRATVTAMNVPLAERIRQVRLNLERWRWMPDDLGYRHLVVNIPEFHLKAFEGQREVLDMRAIVGREGDETPVFSREMTTVVFSPYWNIPETIATDETLPEIANDPGFLERNNIEVVHAGGESPEVVDPTSIDWSDEEILQGLSFRQRPGERNALGLVKFLFPNPQNVYVHDTPGDHLFSRIGRTFSHGCIRIEQPITLAEYLLRDQHQWSPEAIHAAMNAGTEKHVKITRPIPIHLTYFTAWTDANGGVNFRDDVYGYDRAPRALELAKR